MQAFCDAYHRSSTSIVLQFNEYIPCTVDHIRNFILQSLIKSSQLDPIHYALFKMTLELLLQFLHFTSNISLRDGTLHNSEKLANITFILKKSGFEADSASSYCLVSNLTFLFKIIVRLVYRQLT